jgi:hypothetical protein
MAGVTSPDTAHLAALPTRCRGDPSGGEAGTGLAGMSALTAVTSSAGISSPEVSRVNVASIAASLGVEPARPSSMPSRACWSRALRPITSTSITLPWRRNALAASRVKSPLVSWARPERSLDHVDRLVAVGVRGPQPAAATVVTSPCPLPSWRLPTRGIKGQRNPGPPRSGPSGGWRAWRLPSGITAEPAGQPLADQRIRRYRYLNAERPIRPAELGPQRLVRPGQRMLGQRRVQVSLLAGGHDQVPAMHRQLGEARWPR